VKEDFRVPFSFVSENGIQLPEVPFLSGAGSTAVDPLIDVRDYKDRSVSAREVIMKGDYHGILEEGDDMVRKDGVHIVGSCTGGFVRLYARGGLGIAPPSCLCE